MLGDDDEDEDDEDEDQLEQDELEEDGVEQAAPTPQPCAAETFACRRPVLTHPFHL